MGATNEWNEQEMDMALEIAFLFIMVNFYKLQKNEVKFRKFTKLLKFTEKIKTILNTIEIQL